MANYSQLATDIIANVGGAENVKKLFIVSLVFVSL